MGDEVTYLNCLWVEHNVKKNLNKDELTQDQKNELLIDIKKIANLDILNNVIRVSLV